MDPRMGILNAKIPTGFCGRVVLPARILVIDISLT